VSKLHIFDMDGTLLAGSACLELSRSVDQLEAVEAMEREWSRGHLDHARYWLELLPLWEGMTDENINRAFERSAWIGGIADVWRDIADRGEHSAVISMSPDFFVQRLTRWGLEIGHGCPITLGAPFEASTMVGPETKAEIATDLMRHYGLTVDDCVAYGDSASDIPLFRALRHTVAVNATESVRELAAVGYDGDDLRQAYSAGRALLALGSRGGAQR
jgi:phosphoserine phosphatase